MDESGGGGGRICAIARTKNKIKQIPEIKVRRKFFSLIPITHKRKLKPEMIEHTTFRLIWAILL